LTAPLQRAGHWLRNNTLRGSRKTSLRITT